jgi:hypothetical protein
MAARQARRRRPQPSLLWPIAAVAASAGACGAALVGALAASQGVFRLKVGSTVLVSARGGWRAWLVALACVGLRVAIAQVPSARRPVSRLAGRVAAWAAAWWADPLLPYAAFVVLGVWLAIGPPFSLWPYVYWLPGFNFVRVSSRFTLLGMLGLAVLAGAGFDAAATGLTRRMRAIAATVVCALVVLECLVPLGAVPYAIAVPEVDRWLATQPTPFAIAEVPLPDIRQPGLFNKFQSTYMLHSTVHWQKTVHGWSGLMPDTQLELFDALSRFPDRDSLQALRKVHVNYVVVHQDLYPQADWPDVERRLQFPAPGLTLVHTDPSGRVYALRPEP